MKGIQLPEPGWYIYVPTPNSAYIIKGPIFKKQAELDSYKNHFDPMVRASFAKFHFMRPKGSFPNKVPKPAK